MSKPTTIKDAIKRWEEKHPGIGQHFYHKTQQKPPLLGEQIAEASEVGFQFQWPPIEKMDNSLSALQKCKKLSLSTNMIEKIAGISALKNLKILSLGRNYIKSFSGLEGVAETLEELWISYNFIEKVKGVQVLKKLKVNPLDARVLYIGNNMIKDWSDAR
ncbi:hypothetical protein YQE_11593, partial [Dendroctonus ponderosae]